MNTITKDSSIYKDALRRFRAQFGDVAEMTKLYISKENKVFAGEWKDSKGVINFNGGYVLDLHRTIEVRA